MKKICLILTAVCIVAGVHAQNLRIAVAANAQFVVKALQSEFKKSTGIETETIVDSSGNLTTQIKNGAPFDIFLSADMEFPENLQKAGFAMTTPAVYALGSLIICSTSDINLTDWKSLVVSNLAKKIAIANPAVAPYGLAAQQALRKHKLWDKIQPKLVFGESISQVNTYIMTGTVSLGFTTEALLYETPEKKNLKWVRIDAADYKKIRQGFIVLKHAKENNYEAAMKFHQFLLSAPAKQILKKYGYVVM